MDPIDRPRYGGLAPSYVTAIQGFEGFTPRAKWDVRQNSNGYGTRARAPGEVIDRAEAALRLDAELGDASARVRSFHPGLDAGTHAALTSLTFNAGPAWMSSGLGSAVKAGDQAGIRQRFAQYTKANGQEMPGLQTRRTAEAGWMGMAAPATPAQTQEPTMTIGPGMTAPVGGAPSYMSSDQLAYRRKLAANQIAEGTSTAPVKHWTQGVARVLTGVGGAMAADRLDAQERAQTLTAAGLEAKQAQGLAERAPQGGMAGPVPTPAPSPTTPAQLPEPSYASPPEARPALAGGNPSGGGMAGPVVSAAPAVTTTGRTPALPVTTGGWGGGMAAPPQPVPTSPQPPVAEVDPYAARRTRIQSEIGTLAPMLAYPGTAGAARQRFDALRTEMDQMDDPARRTALAGSMLDLQAKQQAMIQPKHDYQMFKEGEQAFDKRTGQWVTPPGQPSAQAKEFRTAAAKQQAEIYGDHIKDGQKATSAAADLQRLGELSDVVGSGTFAAWLPTVGPWVQSLGLEPRGLSEAQAFQAIVARMAPSLRPAGSGATSDRDMAIFMQSLPQISQSREGRQMVIDHIKGLNTYSQQRGQIASAVITGRMAPAEGEAAIQALRVPTFAAALQGGTAGGPGGLRAQAAPQGVTMVHPQHGEMMRGPDGLWHPVRRDASGGYNVSSGVE